MQQGRTTTGGKVDRMCADLNFEWQSRISVPRLSTNSYSEIGGFNLNELPRHVASVAKAIRW